MPSQIVVSSSAGNSPVCQPFQLEEITTANSTMVVNVEDPSQVRGVAVETIKKPRIYYIDTLRFWLTALVVIHHCIWVVTVGWFPFFGPWNPSLVTLVTSFLFLSGNQAYFMGLFFFLSGLVTAPSLKRKGIKLFLIDRLWRLILPTVIYEIILFPLLYCFVQFAWYNSSKGKASEKTQLWDEYFGTPKDVGQVWSMYFKGYKQIQNQMWFTLLLFVFNLVTAIVLKYVESWRKIAFSVTPLDESTITRKKIMYTLLKLASLMFVLNYVIRIIVGTISGGEAYIWIPVIGNLAFIAQYVIAFVVGILATSYNLLDHLATDHLCVTFTVGIICFFLHQMFQVWLAPFFHSLLSFYGYMFFLTLFEQFYALFFSYSLLVLFKQYQNTLPNAFFSKLIGGAYATYIIHQWIVIPLAIGFAYTSLSPGLVILLLCIIAPPLSWAAGLLLKMIPGSTRVL
jgi:hypothetical protein